MKIEKIIFKIKKHAPEELMIAGIAGFVGTVVLACRASFKASEVLDKHSEMMNEIEEAKKVGGEEYTEEDEKKDKVNAYISTAVNFGKLYAPAVLVGAASVTSVIASHNILKNRYLGVVAAYNFVAGAFARYRERVREEYGEDVDRHLRYGTAIETIETEYIDDKGKTKKKKEQIENVVDGPSEYAVYFDNRSSAWNGTPSYDLMFVKCQEEFANHLLVTRGFVILNEVYDALRLPHTSAGAVVGWVLGNGDDYISFGIPKPGEERYRRFVNREENSILLDFNVDGVVWDLIDNA